MVSPLPLGAELTQTGWLAHQIGLSNIPKTELPEIMVNKLIHLALVNELTSWRALLVRVRLI